MKTARPVTAIIGLLSLSGILFGIGSDSVHAATGTGQASPVTTNAINISLSLGSAIAIDVLDDGDELTAPSDADGCDGAGPLAAFTSDPAAVDNFAWGQVDPLCTINAGPHANGQCCVNNEAAVQGATLVMTLHATPTFSGFSTGCSVHIYQINANLPLATDLRFSPSVGALPATDWRTHNTGAAVPDLAANRVNIQTGAVDAATLVTNGATYSHQLGLQFDGDWVGGPWATAVYYHVDCT